MHTVPISPSLAAKRAPLQRADHVGQLVANALDEQKAENILTIQLHNASVVADLMVIASGRSRRHVSAIAENVAASLKRAGINTPKPEGTSECTWVLIDANTVVVHIFTPEIRTFYNLERLWNAGNAENSTD